MAEGTVATVAVPPHTPYALDADIADLVGSVATDAANPARIWNSAFLVSAGRTVGHYDKIRLVPFGEYVPFKRLL